MLPLKLLKVVFGALSRDDLDALMLANVSFRDIVLRDFAKKPLRYFEALNIFEKRSYTFVATTGTEHTCGNDEDFRRRMHHARIGRLAFWIYRTAARGSMGLLFDEDTFQVLLPVKDAWRDAHIITPADFASPSLFYRAFGELFLCKSMLYNTNFHGRLSQPFLSLPAVRECTLVRVFRPPGGIAADEVFFSDALGLPCPPGPITAAEVIDWLKVDARSKRPKRLEVVDYQLHDSVENFVQQLTKDFMKSKTARCYVVKITADGSECERLSGRLVNKEASKVLAISSGPGGTRHCVAVKVEPMDDE